MKFAQEQLAVIWDEVMVLAHSHWQENEQYRHGQGFKPDKQRYVEYERWGLYFHFTAREKGKLVGSGGMYVTQSMHTQRVIATEDTYYLLPEARKPRAAIRFFQYMEDFLRTKDVVEVTLTTPLTNPRAERIVEFMGYTQVSRGWSKHLEKQDVRTLPTAST